MIDLTSSTGGELLTAQQVHDLPLNGRNFTQLALLQPGVTMNQKGRPHLQALGRGPQMIISGARPTGTIYLLDGTIINNKNGSGSFGLTGNTLGTDAIREFQVHVNSFSAEYSRATGGVVNIVTSQGPTSCTVRRSNSTVIAGWTPGISSIFNNRTSEEISSASVWAARSSNSAPSSSQTTKV